MAYSDNARSAFHRAIQKTHSGSIEWSAHDENRILFAEAASKDFLKIYPPEQTAGLRRFASEIGRSNDQEFQDTLTNYLISLVATICGVAKLGRAKFEMWRGLLEETFMILDREYSDEVSRDENTIEAHERCCYFELQGFCYQAFVRTLKFDEEDSEVDYISMEYIFVYTICCQVLWNRIGHSRFLDNLRDEEVVEKLVDKLVDQAVASLTDDANKTPDATSNDPDMKPDEDLCDESDEDLEHKQKHVTGFCDIARDCKCLEAVWMRKIGPSKFHKEEEARRKAKALRVWRGRVQGLTKLGKSPLGRTPLICDPELDLDIRLTN
ncbi:uncharacterized protein F4822DRAFT_440018 [Hypoxylon trugodes]|uniref:uncharacterized protein n=1 Tax=Hypoxylon trugodes TaxID=326681 RepID=UPI0021923EA1|nr:uncharacterized protein F4822DRAFT_440018 [Hypoxylon trugodes]KAI1383751.1 hypothetical protein F4822DRAFT_440018 [Hypoxylon trugodes]